MKGDFLAYILLLGIVIGKLLQGSITTSDQSLIISYCVLAILITAVTLRKQRVISALFLLIYGCLSFICIPNFSKAPFSPGKIIYTGIFALNSTRAILEGERTTKLVKGTKLVPHQTGHAENSYFRANSERTLQIASKSNIHIWSLSLEKYIMNVTSALPHQIDSWFKALFLGRTSRISTELQDALRFLGLYHLAVISGLHFNLIGKYLNKICYLPANFLYSLKLIRPYAHIFLKAFSNLLFLILLTVYANILSFSQPVQRALVQFTTHSIYSVFFGKAPPFALLPYCLCCQAIFFPLSFFEASTFMSWGCYLIAFAPLKNRDNKDLLSQTLIKQLLFTLLTGAVFGEFSIIGVVINVILNPFFPSLLISGIIIVLNIKILPRASTILIEYHLLFHNFCIYLHTKLKNYQFLWFSIHNYRILRVLMGLIVTFTLLKIYKFIPIRSSEQKKT